MEVDLALSAHGNACRWYEMKKKQESKQEKTMTAHEKAFKAAERKTRLQLSQVVTDASFYLLISFFLVVEISCIVLLFGYIFALVMSLFLIGNFDICLSVIDHAISRSLAAYYLESRHMF